MMRDHPMPGGRPQHESSTTNTEGDAAMTSIVAPAIDVEIEYRRERITEDFRRARSRRKVQAVRDGHTVKPRLTPRTA
jgi:hypothetical protein